MNTNFGFATISVAKVPALMVEMGASDPLLPMLNSSTMAGALGFSIAQRNPAGDGAGVGLGVGIGVGVGVGVAAGVGVGADGGVVPVPGLGA